MRRKGKNCIRQIRLNGRDVNYTLRRPVKSRCLRLTIHPNGTLVASKPWFVPMPVLEEFLRQKSAWIFDKIDGCKKLGLPSFEEEQKFYLASKDRAGSFIREKVDFFNRFYHHQYNRISVKNQRTCWGSCSKKGNLNFNWKIMNLPEPLADLIIVHELCHLKVFNHSKEFWRLVGQTIPDYPIRRRELNRRQNHLINN